MNTLVYNTKKKQLIFPGYGRNVQNMVDYCVSISDKEKRQQCISLIIHIMGNMFPYLRDINHLKHILWGHLAVMSNFLLDIDYLHKDVNKENMTIKPQKLHYSQSFISCRHYGKNLEKMILVISEYEESKKKERLINLLAIYMKRSLIIWNNENGELEDSKIFRDITKLSNGKILFNDKSCQSIVQLKYISPKKQKKRHVKFISSS